MILACYFESDFLLDLPDSWSGIFYDLASCHKELMGGCILSRENDYRSILKLVMEKDPFSSRSDLVLLVEAEAFLGLGYTAYLNWNLESAVFYLEKAQSKYRIHFNSFKDGRSLYGFLFCIEALGRVFTLLGNTKEAVSRYEEWSSIIPDPKILADFSESILVYFSIQLKLSKALLLQCHFNSAREIMHDLVALKNRLNFFDERLEADIHYFGFRTPGFSYHRLPSFDLSSGTNDWKVMMRWASLYHSFGQRTDAIKVLNYILANNNSTCRTLKEREMEARALNMLGFYLMQSGEYHEAYSFIYSALEIFSMISAATLTPMVQLSSIRCVRLLSLCCIEIGDLESALKYSKLSLRLAKQLSSKYRHIPVVSRLLVESQKLNAEAACQFCV